MEKVRDVVSPEIFLNLGLVGFLWITGLFFVWIRVRVQAFPPGGVCDDLKCLCAAREAHIRMNSFRLGVDLSPSGAKDTLIRTKTDEFPSFLGML